RLATGALGVVYKARQLSHNRLVALKVVRLGLDADQQVLARFRAQAETLASIDHPNLAKLYEIGDIQGSPYLALELIEGGTLAQKLDGRPQPALEAAALVELLARATHAVHEQGLLHLDLKPSSILLTPDGVPKIADFGLVKHYLENLNPQFTATAL